MVTVLVPLSEYLAKTYDPDSEYVEGVLLERNVGEVEHSEAQSALNAYVRTQVRGFWSAVAVRVQIKADRFRIPDVTIVRGASRRADHRGVPGSSRRTALTGRPRRREFVLDSHGVGARLGDGASTRWGANQFRRES
jgi:hypothetical protein